MAWCCLGEVPYCFSRSSVKYQGHTALKIVKFDPNFIQHKWIQLPYQVYMHLVKIQITLYSWYIIMKYRHVRRPLHRVENPNTVDPRWNRLCWGSKWNLHTVCWGAVGCEWGTTTEAQRYHCIYNLPPWVLFYHREIYFTAARFIFLPPVLFSPPPVLCYCHEIYFNAVSFILLLQVLFYCSKIYFTAASFNFTAASFIFSAASFILLPRDLTWK